MATRRLYGMPWMGLAFRINHIFVFFCSLRAETIQDACMDLRKLKTLIDLVAESDISELEVTEGEGKVRIVKTPPAPAQPMVYAAPPAETTVVAPTAAAPAAEAAPAEPAQEQPEGHTVSAPMVGTFYRAPNQIGRASC